MEQQSRLGAAGKIAVIFVVLLLALVTVSNFLRPVCDPTQRASSASVLLSETPSSTTTTTSSSSSTSSSSCQCPPRASRRYEKFVDPNPSTPPYPNGTVRPYSGPSRAKLRHMPLCKYHFNAAQIEAALAEDPDYVVPVPLIRNRFELVNIPQCEGKKIGVELGVKQGHFADHVLRYWPACTEYWLVDLWAQQKNYDDVANVPDSQQNQFYKETVNILKPFKDKIKFCRNYTTECAKLFPDNYFDFIYIDARHDRLGVLSDLESWWPKLKRGGIFSGHDYLMLDDLDMGQDWTISMSGERDDTGRILRGAIDDFFLSPASRKTDHHRQVTATTRELHPFATWSVRK